MSAPQKASNKGKRVPPPLSGPLPKYTRAPLSDLPIKKSGPRRSSSSRFNEKSRAKLERLPGFHEVPEGQRQDLLVQKIRQCCVVFDFTNPLSDAESKELKREILKELVDY
ncbi:Serine/threonine-protein phosphatase 2A 56 kDa regulatory subunit delta isoform, partial [Balamuthia mandrillaris]